LAKNPNLFESVKKKLKRNE